MLEWLLKSKRCSVHDRLLERDSVPVRYGLIKFTAEYRKAMREEFPHARKFVLGGCRPRPAETRDVDFCVDCREAETKWHEEHPDFDDPAAVFQAVQTARRALPDSLAKRMLRQSELDLPERAGRFLWIVYRLSLDEAIAFNPEENIYTYPFEGDASTTYPDIESVAAVLLECYEQSRHG